MGDLTVREIWPARLARSAPRKALLELDRKTTKNKLLARLPADNFARLKGALSPVELPVRRQLELRNRVIDYIYFIEEGLASMVISAGSNRSIEIGVIGNEGVTGLPVLLGTDRALHETFIQSAGRGWRMAADDLRLAMEESAGLKRQLLYFAQTLVSQMSFTALANGRYKIEERLARWLLMAADRTEGGTIKLTHEFLALMLGARRPGVTGALNVFEKRGIIDADRGTLVIKDRRALEEAANGCYGAPEAEYIRLFGAGLSEKPRSPRFCCPVSDNISDIEYSSVYPNVHSPALTWGGAANTFTNSRTIRSYTSQFLATDVGYIVLKTAIGMIGTFTCACDSFFLSH